MFSTYIIAKAESSLAVDSYPLSWEFTHLTLDSKVESIQTTLSKCKKLLKTFKLEMEEIQAEQREQMKLIQPVMIEKLKNAKDLTGLLECIINLKDEYCSKLYTKYREDEVWYLNTMMQKLKSFKKFLLSYDNIEYSGYATNEKF